MKRQWLIVGTFLMAAALFTACAKKPPETMAPEAQSAAAAEALAQVESMGTSIAESLGISTPGNIGFEIPGVGGAVAGAAAESAAESLAGASEGIGTAEVPQVLAEYTGNLDIAGSWQDEVSKRATMEVQEMDDGTCLVSISWGGSATESAEWVINGKYDPVSGMLSYTDGAYAIYTWDAQGNGSVSDEEVTKGALMMEGEKLRWQDSKLEKDAVFVKLP